jgi:hypothetical protein
MTRKHSRIREAAIGLLAGIILTANGGTATTDARDDTAELSSVAPPAVDVTRFSASYPEALFLRVIPPLPPLPEPIDGDGELAPLDPSPENQFTSLGSVTIDVADERRMLRVSRVTVSPGGSVRFGHGGTVGLLIVESGRLGVIERGETAVIRRGLAPRDDSPLPGDGGAAVDAGDRLTYGPDDPIVLNNPGERAAHLLVASISPIDDARPAGAPALTSV